MTKEFAVNSGSVNMTALNSTLQAADNVTVSDPKATAYFEKLAL